MAAQTAALNHAADGIANKVGFLALYSDAANPDLSSGTSGELSGGGYARAVETTDFTYNAASSGTAALSASVVFDGPASSTVVRYLGFWSNDGSPVYLGSAQLSADKTIGPGDTLTITAAPITVSAA